MTEEKQTEPAALALDAAAPSARARKRWLVPVVIVLLLAVVGGAAWRIASRPAAQEHGGRFGRHGRHGGFGMGAANRTIPVQAATVKTGDLHLYIDGLGTVTAANTAVVKSRVDGQLLRYYVRDGQTVKAGALLAEIDPRPYQVQLAQAEGQLAKDTAALKNAELDLARYRTLLAEDSIARQQVDTQAALVRQNQGTIKADQASVNSARLNLTYAHVTAPISGRLGLRQVDVGNIVHASDATGLVTITQLQPVYVLFTIPEAQLPMVARAVQGGAVLPVDAYDRNQQAKLASGRLLTVDNQIDAATGTIKLKAEFANSDGSLFPNQFVNVHMLASTQHNALLVPTAAIQNGSQGAIVFVVNPDQTVSLRRVKTGPSEGDQTSVLAGLKPGEQVVVDGLDKLRDGTKVEVVVPGMPAPVAGPRKGHRGQGHGGHRHWGGQ